MLRPLAVLLLSVAPHALAQTTGPASAIVNGEVVSGTVRIDFAPRPSAKRPATSPATRPATGPAVDVARVRLGVATTTEFAGELRGLLRPDFGQFPDDKNKRVAYDLDLSVLNPANLAQKKKVGKLGGLIPIGRYDGVYDLSARDPGSRLEISIEAAGRAHAYTDAFGGKLVLVKAPKDPARRTYARTVNGWRVTFDALNPASIYVQDLALAKGPAPMYPPAVVKGRIDLDAATHTLVADGLEFAYGVDGRRVTDRVSGTIRRINGLDYAEDGRGRYAVNLRFNESPPSATAPATRPATRPTATTAAATRPADDALPAFFRSDPAVATLGGSIEFIDEFVPGTTFVAARTLTYRLTAHRLTRPQVMNFVKLWLLVQGPVGEF